MKLWLAIAIRVFEKDLSKFDDDSLFTARLTVALLITLNIQVLTYATGVGTISEMVNSESILIYVAVLAVVYTLIFFATVGQLKETYNLSVGRERLARKVCWLWFLISLFLLPIAV